MRELAYIINPEKTESTSALAIDIVETELTGFTYDFSIPKRPLTLSLLQSLAQEKDKFFIAFITKEKNSTYNHVSIKFSQSHEALKWLASTGKVFFKNKNIVIDLFSKNTLSFHLEPTTDQDLTVSCKIHSTDSSFSPNDCDFICQGPPHWFIRGITLKFLSTDIPWKILKQSFSPWILKKNEQQAFLEQLEEQQPNPPAIHFAKEYEHLRHRIPEPMPLLKLKDRTGAFADLWMDYGHHNSFAFHDTMKTAFKRNFEAEKNWEKDLLETGFIKKDVSTSHYYCPLDKVAKSLGFLLEIGWHIVDHLNQKVVQQTDLHLTSEGLQDKILVKGKIKYDNYETDVSNVIGAFNRRDRFVNLGNNTVGLLPDKWNQSALDSLAADGEVLSTGITIKKNQLGTLAEIWNSEKMTVDASLIDLKEQLKEFKGIEHIAADKSFKGILRPYQQEGLNWLGFLYRFGLSGLLADDMGLGKTVQVLAFLSQLAADGPILIVMPTSLLFNWKLEIAKFLDTTSVLVHHGPNRIKNVDHIKSHRYILTSFATLRSDLPLFSSLHFQCLIVDEAQMMKNSQTQIAQAVYSIPARFRLSISGTPVENHLGELWAHFRFLIPDLLGNEESFLADVKAASLDSRYLERIKKKIKPFVLRRTKEEVLKDLPERIEQTVFVELSNEQRQVYDDFLAGIKGGLLKKVNEEGLAKHRMEVFEAILRLRQICCHPLLVDSLLAENASRSSAKMELLLQDLETAVEEGKKVLIYSQFTSMLQLFAKAFQTNNWPYVYLDGSTVNREKIVGQFQEDPKIPLFLMSLKAGGVGLNLTAADYVFLYDPWWNEAAENQAINRAHRIGRHASVYAKKYIARETIEEKMVKLKETKRTLIDQLIEGDNDRPQLTEEDILFLLT